MAANWTAFVAGNVLTAAQLNDVVDNFQDIAIFNETQAAGTNGGSSTQAFKKRTLNTTVVNNIAGCSISSSVITLATAGTYYFRGSTPGYSCFGIKSKIRNTTASTDTGIGQNACANIGANPGGASSVVECTVTITASTTFELQSRESDITATNGLGGAYSMGVSEIYSQLYIARIA